MTEAPEIGSPTGQPPVLALRGAGPRPVASRRIWDAIVIGSGFGGGVAATVLADAGLDVLVLEQGSRVARGPEAWALDGTLERTSHYPPVAVHAGAGRRHRAVKAPVCVGGGSVFYGGVALRMRESDFDPHPAVRGDSDGWPFPYAELEPAYDETERLLDVAGSDDADPTAPPRAAPYPQRPAPLSPVARRIAAAAGSVGLRPLTLPLAINHRADGERPACLRCGTCDTFACAIEAKNDVATVLLGHGRSGPAVAAGVRAERLRVRHGRVDAVEVVDRHGTRQRLHAERIVLAAGALGTPALLLASGVDRECPAGEHVGRHLTRHCSAIVMGCFPRALDGADEFHKQLGIHDLYDGDPERGWESPVGVLQQVGSPPEGLLRHELPPGMRRMARPLRSRLTGLLAMAHDEPDAGNRVRVDPGGARVIEHRYSRRDIAAREHLIARAREVLRAAGAVHCHVHPIRTFSHAVGTVRMGTDSQTCPVDPDGGFRGVENLLVADGSVLPVPGGVNPSLTIAAVALRSARASVGSRERALAA